MIVPINLIAISAVLGVVDCAQLSRLRDAVLIGNIPLCAFIVYKNRNDFKSRENRVPRIPNTSGPKPHLHAPVDFETAQLVDSCGVFGKSGLMEAAGDWKRENQLKSLIEMGADLNYQNVVNGKTALHYAAQQGSKANVKLLIAAGADVNILDYKNRTPALIASEFANVRAVRGILESGEKVDHVDDLVKSCRFMSKEQFSMHTDDVIEAYKTGSLSSS